MLHARVMCIEREPAMVLKVPGSRHSELRDSRHQSFYKVPKDRTMQHHCIPLPRRPTQVQACLALLKAGNCKEVRRKVHSSYVRSWEDPQQLARRQPRRAAQI